MDLKFTDYEIPLLKALNILGGTAKVKNVYPIIKELMKDVFRTHPEEEGTYQRGQIIWHNKAMWAREYLKRKGQLDFFHEYIQP